MDTTERLKQAYAVNGIAWNPLLGLLSEHAKTALAAYWEARATEPYPADDDSLAPNRVSGSSRSHRLDGVTSAARAVRRSERQYHG